MIQLIIILTKLAALFQQMKKIYFLTGLLLSYLGNCFAQFPEQTNAGRDFWFTSSGVTVTNASNYNYYTDNLHDTAVVYVVGKTACSGYLENPNSAFRIDFTVLPDSITVIKIPENEIMCYPVGDNNNSFQYTRSIESRGIHLQSTEDVYVYLQSNSLNSYFNNFNNGPNSFSYKVAIPPSETYRKESKKIYTIMYGGVQMIVATEDSTVITLPGYQDINTGNVLAGDSSYILNKGEVLKVTMYEYVPCDYEITTNCKPIAVFYSDFHNFTSSSIGRRFYNYSEKNYWGKDWLFLKMLLDDFSYSFWDHQCCAGCTTVQYWSLNNLECFFCNQYYTHSWWIYQVDVGTYAAWCSTPYTNLQVNDIPKMFDINIKPHGNSYFMLEYNKVVVGSGIWRRITSHNSYGGVSAFVPADRQVKECFLPTRNEMELPSDTNYAELVIYIKPESLYSTYLNDNLIPASAFDTFPHLGTRYYACQFGYYNENIPEIFHIRSENGFAAHLIEMGFNPTGNGQIALNYFHQTNSGVNYNDSYTPHTNINPEDSGIVYRCLGDTLFLAVTYNDDSVQIDWVVDGVYYANREHLAIYLSDTGTVEVEMIVQYNCPDTTHTFVHVLPPPAINLPSDTTICSGGTIAVSADHADSYLWSDGSTDSLLTVTQEGLYTVTVSNNGCARSDSIQVSLYPPLTVNLGEDTALCSLIPLLLDATNPHAVSYLWQDQSTNATYTVIYDGEYWVIVHDPCTGNSDTINVLYLEPIELDLGNDPLLCNGEELLLNASTPYCDYLWQDGSTDSIYIVRFAGEYSVNVSNLCFSNQDTITVSYENCDLMLYIPNSFTPDGDGINDYFQPQFSQPEKIKSYTLYIYDRWGGLQFRSQALSNCWDAHGSLPGVYIYLIEYQGETGGKKIAKGTVTVVRK